MKMINITNFIEKTLNKTSKSLSLWSLKTAYKGMSEVGRLQARRKAANRVAELRRTWDIEDSLVADMWKEFYEWTYTYEEKL